MEAHGYGFGVLVTLLLGVLVMNTNMASCSAKLSNNYNNQLYIKSSCNSTTYPDLCNKSLSSYYNKIKSNSTTMVYTALSISIKQAKSTAKVVNKLSKRSDLKPNEVAAVKDCVENIGDVIEELQLSMREIKNLNGTHLDYKLSNIKTWVSAAISDEDSCIDGLEEENVKPDIKKTINDSFLSVAHLTSNALALCNRLNYTQVYN